MVAGEDMKNKRLIKAVVKFKDDLPLDQYPTTPISLSLFFKINYEQNTDCDKTIPTDKHKLKIDPTGGIYNKRGAPLRIYLSEGEEYTFKEATRELYIFKSWKVTSPTSKEISTKVLYKYSINKKINSKKFIVKYDRYIVTNPYDVLNYYEKNNINNKDKYDTSNINKYLNGEGKIKLIKNAINKDKGKKEGNVEITYIIKDKQLLVDNIK